MTQYIQSKEAGIPEGWLTLKANNSSQKKKKNNKNKNKMNKKKRSKNLNKKTSQSRIKCRKIFPFHTCILIFV
jgi:hypothetical protein